MKKKIDWLLIIVFWLMLFLPFLFAHREEERTSDLENRTLAGIPEIMNEDGSVNLSFSNDFDSWINDNVRFRTLFTEINSTLQYKLFHRIANTHLLEGKEGHLYYFDERKVYEYQHADLLEQEEILSYTNSMQKLNDYFNNKGIKYYYMQCYDKYSIYPEFFVEGICQINEMSRAQQVVEGLKEYTDVEVVPVYEALIQNKGTELLYYKAVDAVHWNDHGAYMGYRALMQTIQRDFSNVDYLKEDDYFITNKEENAVIYGFTYPHKENNLYYDIKNPQAVEADVGQVDGSDILSYSEHSHYFINEKAANDLKILLVGDSFIRQFLKEDIAEGFSETLSIDWLNLTKLDEVIAMYHPDIVVVESAEFCLENTIPLVNQIAYTDSDL